MGGIMPPRPDDTHTHPSTFTPTQTHKTFWSPSLAVERGRRYAFLDPVCYLFVANGSNPRCGCERPLSNGWLFAPMRNARCAPEP